MHLLKQLDALCTVRSLKFGVGAHYYDLKQYFERVMTQKADKRTMYSFDLSLRRKGSSSDPLYFFRGLSAGVEVVSCS